MNFIKIIDNKGDLYYVNPTSIAYLKSNPPTNSTPYPNKQVRVHKVVLKNDKQIIIPSESDFSLIKSHLYGG